MSSWPLDFEVGTDATAPSLLPGKDQATTGHHYVAIFPKNERTLGSEKHESSPWDATTTSGQEPPKPELGGRTTIGAEPRDTSSIDRRPSPAPAHTAAAAAETTVVRTHFPGSKERKLKTDDHGIGAFRAAQPAEQKPTIGPTYTDDSPWAEPVAVKDTLTGATSRDVHNAPQSRHEQPRV